MCVRVCVRVSSTTPDHRDFTSPADCGVWSHAHFYTDLRPWLLTCVCVCVRVCLAVRQMQQDLLITDWTLRRSAYPSVTQSIVFDGAFHVCVCACVLVQQLLTSGRTSPTATSPRPTNSARTRPLYGSWSTDCCRPRDLSSCAG